ncbi:hypothetical protein K457DRAFT_857902 [Linnemannia elongata AG-77]|uniref:Uncharacterized protein n=1 Tax=Linnemannia elongata AG-77 TaxID=1314771 RepID=A0A197K8R6_9FUNG|nr:hypothetical protein K457DRAFT_857902 [Linnemannia elongata AG-77]
MLYETPPTRLTRSRTKLGFVLGSYLEQTSLSNPQPPVPLPPTASASSSLPAPSSPVRFPQLQAASDLTNSQQQAQQLQQRKRQKQQKQQNHQIQRKQPKQPARDKTPYDQCLPVPLPSPEPTTKIASPSLSSAIDPNPASDDTAHTANNSINNNIAPNTPNITSSSSEQPPSRPVSQERTRGGPTVRPPGAQSRLRPISRLALLSRKSYFHPKWMRTASIILLLLLRLLLMLIMMILHCRL